MSEQLLTLDETEQMQIPEMSESATDTEPTDAPDLGEKIDTAPEIDYAALVLEDMKELASEFKEMQGSGISDLKNPSRYGALRELGLTPREAYLASGGRAASIDNRAHLVSTLPRRRSDGTALEIPREELAIARSVLSDMSDSELRALYRRVRT